jgi:hypothetical protein
VLDRVVTGGFVHPDGGRLTAASRTGIAQLAELGGIPEAADLFHARSAAIGADAVAEAPLRAARVRRDAAPLQTWDAAELSWTATARTTTHSVAAICLTASDSGEAVADRTISAVLTEEQCTSSAVKTQGRRIGDVVGAILASNPYGDSLRRDRGAQAARPAHR